MFGQKTAFGSTGSAFGTSTSSLFSQNKPVGVTFGSPQQTGATGGLFGSGTGAPATGSLFGNTAASSAGSSLFGSSFGQQSTAPATGGGLFGSTATSKPSLFGGSTATGGGLFGATTATQAQPGTSLFGSSTGATGGGLFGATQTATSGTTIKFDPPINQDTMMKNNIQQSIQTKHLCITAMKAYEQKSLEELRVEDYLANRKGPAAGATTGFSFGSQPQQQTPATGGLFGQTTQTASAAPSLFGTQQKSLFGSTAAPSSTGGGLFGTSASTQSGGLFGQQKSLFGAPATTSAGFNFSTPFSSTATTSSGGLFGAKPATTGGGLFGATGQSAFGQPQTAGTFGFGQPQAKPATGGLFGASTTPFGAQASTANTGFNLASAAPNTGFGATGGSLFGPKPAVSAFSGFQTQTSSAFGQPTGGLGLFGAAQPKPGTGLFGATAPAGGTTGLFGATGQTQGLGTGLFGGAAKTSTPFSFGPQPGTGGMGTAPSFNLGASMPNMAGAGLTIGTSPRRKRIVWDLQSDDKAEPQKKKIRLVRSETRLEAAPDEITFSGKLRSETPEGDVNAGKINTGDLRNRIMMKKVEPKEEPVADEEPRTIFVGNIGSGTSQDEIRDLFARYGEIEKFVFKIKEGHSFAFITYREHVHAERARLNEHAGVVGGRRIGVNWARSESKEAEMRDSDTEFSQSPMHMYETQVTPPLFVGNIDTRATPAEIRSMFERHGIIDNFKMIQKDGHSFAFITYTEKESAERARVYERGRLVWGRRIGVSWARSSSGEGDEREEWMREEEPKGFPLKKNKGMYDAPEELQKTLFVGNIDPLTTEQDIKDIFTMHGTVEFFRMKKRDGHSFAFVTYAEHENAAWAKSVEHGKLVDGRRWGVKWSLSEPSEAEMMEPSGAEPKQEIEDAPKTLFVGNISPETTQMEIREIFENHGELEVFRMKEKDGHSFAFVTYQFHEDADRAIRREHGRIVRERRIGVSWSVSAFSQVGWKSFLESKKEEAARIQRALRFAQEGEKKENEKKISSPHKYSSSNPKKTPSLFSLQPLRSLASELTVHITQGKDETMALRSEKREGSRSSSSSESRARASSSSETGSDTGPGKNVLRTKPKEKKICEISTSEESTENVAEKKKIKEEMRAKKEKEEEAKKMKGIKQELSEETESGEER